VFWYLKIKSGIQVGTYSINLKGISVIAFFVHIQYLKRFSNDDRTDVIQLTHYFCDFNCLLLLLNNILLREVFFCQNLTFIRLTLKAVTLYTRNGDHARRHNKIIVLLQDQNEPCFKYLLNKNHYSGCVMIETQCGNFNWNKIRNLDIGDFCKKIPKKVNYCFSLPTFWRIWFSCICSRKCATTPNFFFKRKGISSDASFERALRKEYNALFVS
jgi:hypothetical protein